MSSTGHMSDWTKCIRLEMFTQEQEVIMRHQLTAGVKECRWPRPEDMVVFYGTFDTFSLHTRC